jgi:hypothetical protein
MTPEELRKHAERRKAEGCDDMIVTLVRSREPGNTVRLLGRKGPVGPVLGTSENGDGRVRVTAMFQCADVLSMLKGYGA